LNYAYLAFDVLPNQLKTAVDGLKAVGIEGFNLTMPHKTAIMEYVDELTPAARLGHSVNTVYRRDGKYIGHSTDGVGYMQSLSDAGFQVTGHTMTLLGAGGAATAICTQAALDGMKEIHLFKRKNATFAKTVAFAEQITKETDCKVFVYEMEDKKQLRESIAQSILLTNATNVGMSPDVDASLITDASMFHPDLIVSDIIYQPRKTRLLELAQSAGCATLNGMYMLLFQGAAAFTCWTGHEMPIKEIKEKYFSETK
jgi:shikimate dehydrogenase